MSVSLLLIHGSKTLVIPLEKELVTIGRHARNTIILPVRTLSRWHCFMYKREGSWFIQDGDFNSITGDADQWSLNGTFLNGQCIKGLYDQFMLVDGDLITFGIPSPDADPRIVFRGFITEELERITGEHDYE